MKRTVLIIGLFLFGCSQNTEIENEVDIPEKEEITIQKGFPKRFLDLYAGMNVEELKTIAKKRKWTLEDCQYLHGIVHPKQPRWMVKFAHETVMLVFVVNNKVAEISIHGFSEDNELREELMEIVELFGAEEEFADGGYGATYYDKSKNLKTTIQIDGFSHDDDEKQNSTIQLTNVKMIKEHELEKQRIDSEISKRNKLKYQ